MYPPQGYQSNAPPFTGKIAPVVIYTHEEYQKKGSEYMADKSKPRFRVVYFHEFRWGVESGMESYDPAFDYQMSLCLNHLSHDKNYSQWIVNNQFEYFSKLVFEITYKSGIIFFRDNEIVEILNGCDYDAFRSTLNQLNALPVKHSPKKNRLLAEKAAKEKENPNKNKTKSSNGCIVM
ncbi:hypothetical protein FB645_005255 [Coemansia sp. IMI 203386]|nr:hypothetical protein FB645_005255 [Coemansia sp. IMI 203386]